MSDVRGPRPDHVIVDEATGWEFPRASCTTPDCASCGEGCEPDECPNSRLECGHHCNHTWTHDSCCWCQVQFGEDGVTSHPTPTA